MKKHLFAVLFVASIGLTGCGNNTSTNQEEPEADVKKVVLHGKGAPDASLGEEFDHYYDEDSKLVYEKRDGAWMNQFTIGSSSLYTTYAKERRAVGAGGVDVDVLRNALVDTLYSTNYTCMLNPVFRDVERPSYKMLVEVDKGFTKITDIFEDETGVVQQEENYGKIDENGQCYGYSKETSQYYALSDGNNWYCVMPFPTLENILFQNFLLIDDNLGQLTSIVCSQLNNLQQKDGYYVMEELPIHHGKITSHYCSEPTEDDVILTYKFKLDENNQFLDEAEVTFVSDSLKAFGYDTIHYDFSNIRTTEMTHPE